MNQSTKQEMNNRGCLLLVSAVINLAFKDLYNGNSRERTSAKNFFKSPLFIATGLSFDYLNKKYKEGAFGNIQSE